MARSLALKVPTASLISLVEEKIANIQAEIANYPASVKAYKEAYKAYKSELLSVALNAIKNNPELLNDNDAFSVDTSYRGDIQVTIGKNLVSLPEMPEKPQEPNTRTWYGREHSTPLEMLTKTLKVLRMTQQEEVNASTYSSVMDLL
jgi:hypothetical protein